MDLNCSICGDPLNKLFTHKLVCGHEPLLWMSSKIFYMYEK